ncbi:MAG: HAD family hydrolase [Lentisphaerae bacterium]|nr:HAD family hydrolase [Victivallaceae bacterium]MDD3704058.1 HAD family hydrolase [Victivallaceae bacterium]NLK83661.1 HAD family hydrolase [Lentisphaerota bacterium]
MTVNNIKVIALDIGGVCIKLNHQRCLGRLGISAAADLPEGFGAACNLLECGLIDEYEWLKRSRAFLPETAGMNDDSIMEIFNDAIDSDVEGMAEFAKAMVDAGYRLVYFSNTSELHAMEVARKLSFAPLITGAIYSFEVGVMKPDPAIYQAFEERFGVPVAYFDDRLENIEVARKRGWCCQHFTDAESATNFMKKI